MDFESVSAPEPDDANGPAPTEAVLLEVSELPVEAFDALVLSRPPCALPLLPWLRLLRHELKSSEDFL